MDNAQQAPHWTMPLWKHPPPMEDEARCTLRLWSSPDDGVHHIALSLAAAFGRTFHPPPTNPSGNHMAAEPSHLTLMHPILAIHKPGVGAVVREE